MKLKYLIYTITLTSLTACSDFLEPKSQSKYIPKDANALQEMLIGEAYPQQGNTKFLAYLEILADDIDQNQVEGYEFPENEQGKMETFEVLYSWQPNMFEMQQKLGQKWRMWVSSGGIWCIAWMCCVYFYRPFGNVKQMWSCCL